MKSYSERRQAIYFQAARDMWRVAIDVLNDCTQPAEFQGRTAEWAKNLAKATMEQGYALENLGHEETMASRHMEAANQKVKDTYSLAVDRHMRLTKEYRAISA